MIFIVLTTILKNLTNRILGARTLIRLLLLPTLALFLSCGHEPVPTCLGVTIKVDAIATDADVDKANGTIIVSAEGEGKFFQYRINDGQFQASNKFSFLDSGNYRIEAKSSAGCIGQKSIRVGKVNPCLGITFSSKTTNTLLGQSTGKIEAVFSGGPQYTFSVNKIGRAHV